jgi:NAD(P)-dependent dehydrogenase (short-subunit alcohol dehydrogenase family)
MTLRLDKQVAIVTGAASGMGEAISTKFLAEGATVIGLDVNKEGLQSLSEKNDLFTGIVADIQDHEVLSEIVDDVVLQHGTINILINNAGISYYNLTVDTTIEQWRHTHKVNLEAQFVLSKLVAPIMAKAEYGRIVNISSTQSIATEATVSAYAATKGGINAFTRCLAVELAVHNINVNAIAPGVINTPMSIIDGVDETETEYFQEWYIKHRKIPLARPGQASEIASAALFLSSEECSYITGQLLVVDGGLTITF